MRTTLLFLSVVSFALSGCDKAQTPAGDPAAPAAQAAAKVELPPGDPASTQAAQAVAACSWSAEDRRYDDACPALEAWSKLRDTHSEGDDFEQKDAARQHALLGLLGAQDPKHRRAAAVLLADEHHYGRDATAVAAILSATEGEQDESVRSLLVRVAADVELDANSSKRALALAQAGDVDTREAFVRPLAKVAKQCPECAEFVRKAAGDASNSGVQLTALSSLELLPEPQTCTLLAELYPKLDWVQACTAMTTLGNLGPTCAAVKSDVVAAVEQRVKADTEGCLNRVSDPYMMKVQLEPALRQRFVSAARTVASSSSKGTFKIGALELLAKHDAGARAFIAGFAKDKFLEGHVKALLVKLDGQKGA